MLTAETKILVYVLFAASLFLFQGLWLYLFFGLVLLVLLTRIPFRAVRAGWLPISLFLAFTFAGNLLNHQGRIVAATGPFVITDEGINAASLRTGRLVLMIAGAKAMMGTTKTVDLIDGLGRLLGPLERIGIPMKDFFHTMGLTVQCFPGLKDVATETYRREVVEAEVRGFWEKAKVISGFLMPMFARSMRAPEEFFRKEKRGEEEV